MSTKKPKLYRFYLSEKYDENRHISFNLKRAGIKAYTNFKSFKEGVEEFNAIAAQLDGDSRIWFHQNGAYRGSATPEKTVTMLSRVQDQNVRDEEVIEFINKEELVDVTPSKVKKETVEAVEEVKEVIDLDKVAKELKVFVNYADQKIASEVTLDDVLSSETEYEFVATALSWNDDNTISVAYVVRHGEQSSKEYTRLIDGFKAIEMNTPKQIYTHYVSRTIWGKPIIWLWSFAVILEIICIIILVLRMYVWEGFFF